MTESLLLKPAAPAQLPTGVRRFTGRTALLARLCALDGGEIAMLTGPAGIGKTSLAVHWARRSADEFPDGQLFVNLRGFDHAVPPVEPADALRRFLAALGVPARRIPAGLDERVALYRAEMADRRALVVLDNATVATQVRPLLPAARNCVTVVTSRNQLTGLIVREAARPMPVPPLTIAEAAQFLGGYRPVIEQCGGLPLALSLVAARTGEPEPPGRDDDPHAGARAVFGWAYRALTPTAARIFRLLGRSPAYDLTATAVAALAGLPIGQAAVMLAELARTGLLIEFTPGRYLCHDLLHTYAAELTAR
jgi:hypothetical protein